MKFELIKSASKQNGRSLPTYYNELVGMFREIDQCMASQTNTIVAMIKEALKKARMQVHIFLSGLDLEYDQVCGEILHKDPKFGL